MTIARNPMQQQVQAFHEANGAPVGTTPTPLAADRVDLRIGLIREELDELIEAVRAGDLVETYDAALDILYVTFGLLVELGTDAQAGFDEVQASNMSKLGDDGKPILSDGTDGYPLGKILKGPHYFRPDLRAVLRAQGADV